MIATIRKFRARRTARRLLASDALILDTETTDMKGDIIEVAVIEAATGNVLVNTLIKPPGQINPEATQVHGITDDMCRSAPSWQQIWPTLRGILEGRIIVAYNAPYDAERIHRACADADLPAPAWRWSCLMRLDAAARGARRWRALNGGHRALGDVNAARDRLLSIAAGGAA